VCNECACVRVCVCALVQRVFDWDRLECSTALAAIEENDSGSPRIAGAWNPGIDIQSTSGDGESVRGGEPDGSRTRSNAVRGDRVSTTAKFHERRRPAMDGLRVRASHITIRVSESNSKSAFVPCDDNRTRFGDAAAADVTADDSHAPAPSKIPAIPPPARRYCYCINNLIHTCSFNMSYFDDIFYSYWLETRARRDCRCWNSSDVGLTSSAPLSDCLRSVFTYSVMFYYLGIYFCYYYY